MMSLLTQPQLLATAATDVAEIRSAIGAATAAAAGRTTGMVAAAQDEVSTAAVALFGVYGKEYQPVLKQAAAFHEEFAAALAAAGKAYAQAEAANATAISAVGTTGSAAPLLKTLSDPVGQPHRSSTTSRVRRPRRPGRCLCRFLVDSYGSRTNTPGREGNNQ